MKKTLIEYLIEMMLIRLFGVLDSDVYEAAQRECGVKHIDPIDNNTGLQKKRNTQ